MAVPDVFMDSSGFLALWDSSDSHHSAALRLQGELAHKHRRFVTTDYILDETVTLLLVRHSHAAAEDFLDSATRSQALYVEWVGQDRFYAAAGLFNRHRDKQWSFTDCTSFSVMRELKIRDSFTTDRHFLQAGFTPLLNP
jgi:predicted nucleic acid-binding protein